MPYQTQVDTGGPQRVLKNRRMLHIPPVWSPTFFSQHLGVLSGLTDTYNISEYRNPDYRNDDSPLVLELTTSYTTQDPVSAYQHILKNHIGNNVGCGPHFQAHCYDTGNLLYIPVGSFVRGYNCCDSDFLEVADTGRDIGGSTYPIYHVDWDSAGSREKWVRRMISFAESANAMYRPYRRMTHIVLDNCQLNQQEFPPRFDYRNQLLALGELRSAMHNYLGALLIVNFSSYMPRFTVDEIDDICQYVDGFGAEQPWHPVYGKLVWDHTSYGMMQNMVNVRRVMQNGVIFVSWDGQPFRVVGDSRGVGYTFNGETLLTSQTESEGEWDRDLQTRFEAAMAMIAKPSQDSRMVVHHHFDRKSGVYDADGFIGGYSPGPNEWISKDWMQWPSELGGPVGDYTVDVIEGGAGSYNTASQTFVNCDAIEISREFENGSIVVDVTADLSDDVNIRFNAVNATIV